MGFEQTMDAIARGVEVIGIATLVLGLAAALVRAAAVLAGGHGAEEAYGSSGLFSDAASCWGWSSWSRPTSSGLWPCSRRSRTSPSWG